MTLPESLYWREEGADLWDEVAPFFIAMLYAGGEEGLEMLPDVISAFINWDYFNQNAIDYLREYRLAWVTGIAETTRQQSVETIATWIEAGESIPVLEAKLAPIFGANRAKMIAITEVTNIFAKGNQLAWEATGLVTEKVWRTAEDEKVCFPAGTLVNTEDGQRNIQTIVPGDKVLTRAGLKRVKAIGSRLYGGEMITIHTSRHDPRSNDYTEYPQLTATKDHPILCNGHWREIQYTHEGDMVEDDEGNHRQVYEINTENKELTVYNLEVEDLPEYYANGILVHNCPICGTLANTTVGIDELFFYSPEDIANSPQMAALVPDPDKRDARTASLLRGLGAFTETPPAHPRCRCRLQPVVTEVGLERELDKILNKAEIAKVMEDLRSDSRVDLIAKPVKWKRFQLFKTTETAEKQEMEKLIDPIREKMDNFIAEQEEGREDMKDAFKEITEAVTEGMAEIVNSIKETPIEITVEPTPITIENVVEAASVEVEAPVVNVDVAAPKVTVEAPDVTVEAPVVNVENKIEQKKRTTKITRDGLGNITEMETK